MKNKVSPEVEAKSLQIAKGTQKPGQTKEQTKLIAQGIEKGIAEYKKQQGKKSRELDKQRKQKLKQRDQESLKGVLEEPTKKQPNSNLPWGLLLISWAGFIGYYVLSSAN